jgi:hypothetical protein
VPGLLGGLHTLKDKYRDKYLSEVLRALRFVGGYLRKPNPTANPSPILAYENDFNVIQLVFRNQLFSRFRIGEFFSKRKVCGRTSQPMTRAQ